MAKGPASRRVVPPRDPPGPPANADALKGALLAFGNHATPPKAHSPMNNMASRPPTSLLDSDPEPPPELPEPGSIRDKIALFSANPSAPSSDDRPSTALSAPDISRQKTPQLRAAEVAAGSSPGASSNKTANAVDTQRGQQRNPKVRSRELPSPVPIRKPLINPQKLLDPYPDNQQGLSPPKPDLNQTPSSRSSASPRPPITKPRPAPPPVPRKPSPALSEPVSFGHSFGNQHRHDESSSRIVPLRSKASAATLPEERPPALPPRRSATVQDAPEHSHASGRAKSPGWPSNASATSIYSSQNPSSTSLLDSHTDVSKDGTSDAVAASSLASNRALQSRKSPPPPPPQRRRRSRSRSLLHLHHQHKMDRTPNPSPGGLRDTLRTPAKSDDEGDKNRRQHRNHIIKKHPHKLQEGDRKRWRSEITEKERKRYEGVWAANKGLVIPPSQVIDHNDASEETPPNMYPPGALGMVVNLVVRDIWSRSRLPAHVLEQVWNLVDGQNIGMLTRAEFVVGMWLIDQQLKGHKLPAVVPDSVWASATRIPGISLESHYTKH